MAKTKFTLTSYDPVYCVAPEVIIAEDAIRAKALQWLRVNYCKDGKEPKLNDAWISKHVHNIGGNEEVINTVDDLMIFIRYNMYKENREVQKLSDQNYICAALAERLVEELPAELVEQALFDSRYRLEDMLYRNGLQVKDYCKQRGITEEQLYEDTRVRTIQSLKEDSALKAYAEHANYTLTPDDFYAVIPGDSIEDKAYKRRQMELEGRLPQLEEYACMTKALNEVMENAMVKRDAEADEYMRYGDVSQDVMSAYNQQPESFMTL